MALKPGEQVLPRCLRMRQRWFEIILVALALRSAAAPECEAGAGAHGPHQLRPGSSMSPSIEWFPGAARFDVRALRAERNSAPDCLPPNQKSVEAEFDLPASEIRPNRPAALPPRC